MKAHAGWADLYDQIQPNLKLLKSEETAHEKAHSILSYVFYIPVSHKKKKLPHLKQQDEEFEETISFALLVPSSGTPL